jgi:hypothetical protein
MAVGSAVHSCTAARSALPSGAFRDEHSMSSTHGRHQADLIDGFDVSGLLR